MKDSLSAHHLTWAQIKPLLQVDLPAIEEYLLGEFN